MTLITIKVVNPPNFGKGPVVGLFGRAHFLFLFFFLPTPKPFPVSRITNLFLELLEVMMSVLGRQLPRSERGYHHFQTDVDVAGLEGAGRSG